MATRLQQRYAEEAKKQGLLIPEFEGVGMGIGTRDELNKLIADGVLPERTTLREPVPSDF